MNNPTTASPSQDPRRQNTFSADQWRASTESPSVLDDYLTKHEAAQDLRVAERTLVRWHSLGTAPRHLRLGGRTYYRRRSITAFLEELEDKGAASQTDL